MTERAVIVYNYLVRKEYSGERLAEISVGGIYLDMKKWKSITLLTLLSLILVFLVTMTFVRFPAGIKDYNSVLGAIDLDYDMEGGVTYTLTLAEDNDKDVTDVNEVINTLSDRMERLGYEEFSITALKPVKEGVAEEDLEYDIRVSAKATDSIATDITTVASFGTIKFFAGNSENPTEEILSEVNAVKSAEYTGSADDGQGGKLYQVALEFTDEAYDAIIEGIDKASSEGASYYLSITLGETELLPGTSALSKDYISDDHIISIQSTTEANAKQLALQLETGGLAYKYEVSEYQKISAPLGDKNDLFAMITVFSLVAVAMVMFFVKFKENGFVAMYSLLAFIVTECAMMIAVPGIVFSIGGMIGAIIATVLCIDGLAIIFKRIKEESENGKTKKSAIRLGYKRSFLPIVSSNVIVGITALVLFFFSAGAVKAFAIALGIGVVISFLVSIVISRMFIEIISPLTKKDNEALKTQEGK